MSLLFVAVTLVMNGIFGVEIFSKATACSSHLDCNSGDVCCKLSSNHSEFRCRKNLYPMIPFSFTRSCVGYYCTRNSDCRGRKSGKGLCCVLNRCDPCMECKKHSDCRRGASCCTRAWFQKKKCKYTCVGTLCAKNDHCGIGECCRYSRCDYCSNPGCLYDRGCPTGQYCCDKDFFPNTKCRRMCFGGNCTFDSDCVWSARCDSNTCVERDKCANHANCSRGLFCCKSSDDNIAYCRQSCIGYRCYDDSHCGPADECCIKNRCHRCGVSCTSSLDCFEGALCCKGALFGKNKCALKCDNEACIVNTNCAKPMKWCVSGVCSDTKSCNSDSDCLTSYPEYKQSYCCINKNSGLKNCAKSGCPWRLPKWLIGVLITLVVVVVIITVCCWYSRRKLNMRRSDAVQNTMPSGDNNERSGNDNDRNDTMPSGDNNERSGNDNDRNDTMPSDNNNERSGNANDRNEPNPLSYSLINRSGSTHNELSTDTTDNPNIPPPPYSFEEQSVLPDHNNEPPPRYRLIQL